MVTAWVDMKLLSPPADAHGVQCDAQLVRAGCGDVGEEVLADRLPQAVAMQLQRDG